MSKVLFVKANDRPADQAVSVKMHDAFIKTYKEANPNDNVTELDLYELNLPYYGNTAITGLYKRSEGIALTDEEANAADLVEKYLNQFLEADKVVFAFPLWNFTVPAPLITYMSYLAQAGKTFKYTAEGPVGLAGDKKVVLLSARGSNFSEGPIASMEMCVNYMKSMLGFFGVANPEVIVIEGHAANSSRAEEIIGNGLEEVTKAAAKF